MLALSPSSGMIDGMMNRVRAALVVVACLVGLTGCVKLDADLKVGSNETVSLELTFRSASSFTHPVRATRHATTTNAARTRFIMPSIIPDEGDKLCIARKACAHGERRDGS